MYRAALKFHKRAAVETIKKRMSEKNLDRDFFIEVIMEIEDRNTRNWRKVDCGLKAKAKNDNVEVDKAESEIDDVIESGTSQNKPQFEIE